MGRKDYVKYPDNVGIPRPAKTGKDRSRRILKASERCAWFRPFEGPAGYYKSIIRNMA